MSNFDYVNDNGLKESVEIELDAEDILLNIKDSIGGKASIYIADTTKLIAALKAAYEYETGEVI